MTKRIVTAIVGITALAVAGFGVPLAITVARMYHDQAVAKLERDATAAAAEISLPLSPTDPPETPPTPDGAHVSVYNANGSRVSGDGPLTAEAPIRSAVNGPITQ